MILQQSSSSASSSTSTSTTSYDDAQPFSIQRKYASTGARFGCILFHVLWLCALRKMKEWSEGGRKVDKVDADDAGKN
jgi:hypothetical protein